MFHSVQRLTNMYFKMQYDLIKSSREVLLQYCSSIKHPDFILENSSFGRGSIRNLLVHIADTYMFWIGKQALQQNISFKEYKSYPSLAEVKDYFNSVDKLADEFIGVFQNDSFKELKIIVNENTISKTPFELFTHVITHEFHHKGQILSLSRHLGYLPVDTDIIR